MSTRRINIISKEASTRSLGTTTTTTTTSTTNTGTHKLVLGLFDIDEIVLGKKVQSSSSSSKDGTDMYEIKAIKPNTHRGSSNSSRRYRYRHHSNNNNSNVVISDCTQLTRDFMEQHVKHDKTGESRYAIKFLKPSCMKSPHDVFEQNASELFNEAEIMLKLNHPNIAKVRATATMGAEAYYVTGRHDSYFLIVDHLPETLADKLQKKFSMTVLKTMLSSKRSNMDFITQRIQMAHDIADALHYLHTHNIVHANLNPSNIGFNSHHGQLQITNFKFAKEQQQTTKMAHSIISETQEQNAIECRSTFENEQFVLDCKRIVDSTKHAMKRYIAPEIYNAATATTTAATTTTSVASRYSMECMDSSADVYSFSILLCDILGINNPRPLSSSSSSTLPFQDLSALLKQVENILDTLQQQQDSLAQQQQQQHNDWKSNLLELLQQGLSDCPMSRPTMSKLRDSLGDVLFHIQSTHYSKTLLYSPATTASTFNNNGSSSSSVSSSSSIFSLSPSSSPFSPQNNRSRRRSTHVLVSKPSFKLPFDFSETTMSSSKSLS